MREALCRQTAEHHVPLKIFGNQNSKAYAQASLRLSLSPCDDFFGNVASTALFDRLSALAAEQSGIPRKDEFEAIIDLCHRAHGRTRGLDAVGLIDGDGRRHPVDFVDLRTVAAFQKLAGVSAERFDVTALSFSVKRVVGKRAFARSRRTGNDGHRAWFNVEIQVSQIVLAGSANADGTDVCSVGDVRHGK